MSGGQRVLVTGASGYLGGKLVQALAEGPWRPQRVVAADVRPPAGSRQIPAVLYEEGDVRDAGRLHRLVSQHRVDTVVHLASVVTPDKDGSRERAYQVDVDGTRNVLEACLAGGVAKLIVASSGAAYGYHPENRAWLDEDDPIRGHDRFAYAHHKRLVEEMLEQARRFHPGLAQLVFRPGTVLGTGVANQITALFEKPVMLGVAGSASPFVFIWDEDVVACLVKGIREPVRGVYNLAGDGALSGRELAARMGKPYLPLPAWLITGALAVLHPLGMSRYGPEQVDFLRYRPVLSNRRLKEVFGYVPRKTSAEVFDLWWGSR